MALSFTTNQPGATADYRKYLYGNPIKKDRLNENTFLDFSLAAYGAAFVKLVRGTRIVLSSSTYANWFTGYITNDPALTFLGTKNNVPQYGYTYEATDDSYILNLKPIGILQPFVNTTAGAIIKSLVSLLDDAPLPVIDPMTSGLNAAWTNTVGSLAFDGTSALKMNTLTSNQSLMVWSGLTFDPNQYAQITISAVDASQDSGIGVAVRCASSGLTCYRFVVSNNLSTMYLVKMVAGAATNLTTVSGTVSAGDVLRIEVNGSNLTAKKNGVVVLTATDSTLTSGKIGIEAGALSVPNAWRANNFQGGNLFSTFDVSNVVAGPQISRYIVDPNKKFTEVIKDFTDPMGFRWRCNNNALTYQKQDTTAAAIAVNGNSKHFNASRLQVRATADPFVNDVVVVGTVEPQTYIDEYFLGDGFTANYPLMSSVFGVTSALLIDETFGGGGISSQNWTIFDPVSTRLVNSNGYLNILGGAVNNSFDTYLQSSSVIALESTLRMTHGQWDFINTAAANVNGVIGSLWTQAPNSSFTGCVYGIRVNKVGSVTTLNPISAGTVDTGQSLVVDFTKRYVLRTVATFARHQRYGTTYNCRTQAGAINSFTPTFPNDSVVFQTYLVAVDPTTGALSAPVLWSNTQASLSNATTFASYIPAVSNDLHATVTGITVSYTMAAGLDITPSGGSAVNQIIGPNEIDSLDGLAPVATIVQSQGTASRNNNLGTVQANPGDASLAFFKDTTKQTTTVPPVKSVIHLSYRHAGNAVGRVQNASSVSTESTAWGDNGIRSITRTDLSPLPRSAAEAEMAAAALLSEYSYQHWEGSYIQDSAFEFTGEPISGTILQFSNLSSAYPTSLVSAVITEVDSEMIGDSKEHFTHTVNFGKLNRVQTALSGFAGKSDVLGTLDPVDTLPFVPLGSVGTVFAPDIVNAALVSVDPTNYNFTTNQNPPAGGGFEIRATDESWGSDPSRNLITTVTGQTFSVPRTIRGRVCFVRAYDVRNKAIFSEDMTNAAWVKGVNTVVTLPTGKSPDGNSTSINSVAWSGSGGRTLTQTTGTAAASQPACFSVSIKGTAGLTVQIQLAANTVLATNTVTLTGRWQRVSVSGTFSSGATGNIKLIIQDPLNTVSSLQATWASLEIALAETAYFKTSAAPYGANSRYSAGLRCNFPLIPPAPTGTVDYTNPILPIVTVVLPGTLQDVWGVEIRASNNTTVLYHKDLTDSGYVPQVPLSNTTGASLSYFIYTYNLLGEFSSSFNLTATIPPLPFDGVYLSPHSSANLVFNGDFSLSTPPTGIICSKASSIRTADTGGASLNGWTRVFESVHAGEGVIYQGVPPVGTGLLGPNYLILQDSPGPGAAFAAVCDAFAVRAGLLYNFSADIFAGLGGTGLGGANTMPLHASWYFRVLWYKVGAVDFSKASADLISFTDIIANSLVSGIQHPVGQLAAPSNAGFCRIAFYHWDDGTATSSSWNLVVSNVRCVPTLDDAVDGTIYIKTPQYTGTQIIVDNANFEASASMVLGAPPGWLTGGGAVCSYETSTPHAGNQSLKVVFSAQFNSVNTIRRWAVRPGDSYRLSLYMKSDGAMLCYAQITWIDKTGAFLGSANTPPVQVTSWTFQSITTIAPANAVFASVWLTNGSVGGGTGWYDDLNVTRTLTAFEVTPINTSGHATVGGGALSQVGVSGTISVASKTIQYGDGLVTYSAGSVAPGLGTWYVFCDDPSYSGGAVTYQATATESDVYANNGRIYFGKITLSGGGGGASTGAPGTGGGRLTLN